MIYSHTIPVVASTYMLYDSFILKLSLLIFCVAPVLSTFNILFVSIVFVCYVYRYCMMMSRALDVHDISICDTRTFSDIIVFRNVNFVKQYFLLLTTTILVFILTSMHIFLVIAISMTLIYTVFKCHENELLRWYDLDYYLLGEDHE